MRARRGDRGAARERSGPCGERAMSDVGARLRTVLPAEAVHANAPLAPFTTFKVGGPADWLVHAHRAADVEAVLSIAKEAGLPAVVLGGGSNVLIADAGIRGIVIRVHGGDVRMIRDGAIRADAGLTINGLVRWTINRGVAGVEMWAGTPGTVGGAVHGNAHFRGRLIGDLIGEVEAITPDGRLLRIPASEMAFGYDRSRMQRSGEIVLSVDFR